MSASLDTISLREITPAFAEGFGETSGNTAFLFPSAGKTGTGYFFGLDGTQTVQPSFLEAKESNLSPFFPSFFCIYSSHCIFLLVVNRVMIHPYLGIVTIKQPPAFVL